MAPSADALREPTSDDEREALRGVYDLLDRPLLTHGGDMIGKIGDVEFDEADGQLAAFVVGDSEVPLGRIVAIGPFAVIVSPA